MPGDTSCPKFCGEHTGWQHATMVRRSTFLSTLRGIMLSSQLYFLGKESYPYV